MKPPSGSCLAISFWFNAIRGKWESIRVSASDWIPFPYITQFKQPAIILTTVPSEAKMNNQSFLARKHALEPLWSPCSDLFLLPTALMKSSILLTGISHRARSLSCDWSSIVGERRTRTILRRKLHSRRSWLT